MFLNPFTRRTGAHALAVGMVGAKMGDRIAQVGCADGGRLAAVAAKVGLSGRAVVYVPDETSAARARKGGEKEGVLIEVEIAPPTQLPADDDSFDLVIADDTGALFGGLTEHQRAAAFRELRRIVRPGGRVMIIGAGAPTGVGAFFRTSTSASYDRVAALQHEEFKSARTLAEREGLIFVEAVKPRP